MYGASIIVCLCEMLTLEDKGGTCVLLLCPHFRLDRIVAMPEASIWYRGHMASCGVGRRDLGQWLRIWKEEVKAAFKFVICANCCRCCYYYYYYYYYYCCCCCRRIIDTPPQKRILILLVSLFYFQKHLRLELLFFSPPNHAACHKDLFELSKYFVAAIRWR